MNKIFNYYDNTWASDSSMKSSEEMVEIILKDVFLERQTSLFRETGNQSFKDSTARFAVACHFNGGKAAKHIIGLTGFTLCDFDHLTEEQMQDVWQKVTSNPHTYMAYHTISNHGIRTISRYDLDASLLLDEQKARYKQAFAQVNRYYVNLCGVETDGKCKDITRLSGLAHDSEVYYNSQAEPCAIDYTEAKRRDEGKPKHSGALYMDSSFYKVMALLEDLGLTDSSKSVTDVATAIVYARKELADAGIAYEPHHYNEYISRLGYKLKDFGIDDSVALAYLMSQYTDYPEIPQIVHSCYNTPGFGSRKIPKIKSADADRNEKPRYAKPIDIKAYLDSKGKFRKNEISGEIEFAPNVGNTEGDSLMTYRKLEESDLNTFEIEMLDSNWHLSNNAVLRVIKSDWTPTYHPFKDYLSSLHPWDGQTDYIGRLASTVHLKDESQRPFFNDCFKRWFVGFFPAILEPNEVNHTILILVGPQGTQKTTWFLYLMPPCLQSYATIMGNSSRFQKDDLFKLTEFMLIVLDEMSEMTSREMNVLKSVTTRPVIDERQAYDRLKSHRKHIASFCGTSNNQQFINDPTGSRRFLPFEVKHLDNPRHINHQYEGVYAQAYALYNQVKANEKIGDAEDHWHYWFSLDEIANINKHNTNFEISDVCMEFIATHLRKPLPGEEGTLMSSTDILSMMPDGLKSKADVQKIGRAMSRLGYQQFRRSSGRTYRVVVLDQETIERNSKAEAALVAHEEKLILESRDR